MRLFLSQKNSRFIGLFLATATMSLADPSLLTAINLPGTESVVKWTNLSNTNTALTPSVGSGTVAVAAPGYKATAGFYSYSGDYAVTTSATAAFDISNVVLQFSAMPNTDFASTYLLTNGGGPVLTYTYAGGTGTATATFSAVLSGPLYVGTTTVPGDYYGFAWQWDLSAVSQTITGISIASPIMIHTSITGVQLNLSDTFSGSVIPEPSTYVMFAGAAALGFAFWRRRRTA